VVYPTDEVWIRYPAEEKFGLQVHELSIVT